MRMIRKGLPLLLAALLLFSAAAAEGKPAGGKGTVRIWDGGAGGFTETAEAVFVPTTIIGSDNRTVIEDVTEMPYRAVAFLDVVCECGCGWECSGFLAGPDIVITAAHSLVCAEHSSPAETLIIYFGYESYRKNLYRYDGEWTALAGNYFEDHEYSFRQDWGIVRLEENVGDEIGILTPEWEANQEEAGGQAAILGYSASVLYRDEGELSVMDDTHYQYTMDQDSGSSGGPILSADGRVIGIVIGHQEDDDGVQSNVGLRLTEELRQAYEELTR